MGTNLGNRINVVGTTGTGKTTVGRRLSEMLGIPFVELDALFWEPDWTGAPESVFRERVEDAVGEDHWVIDGNYSRMRDVIWARVRTVVWLDFPLRTAFWQLLRRTVRRAMTKEELWSGNRESWMTSFGSRDSILVWLFRSYWRQRRRYPHLTCDRRYSHINFVRLRSPADTAYWLGKLSVEPTLSEPS